MYGLINKAIQELVCERFGEDAWNRICSRAGVPAEPFLSLESYPDAITYDIVAAAAVELGLPATDILRAFGRHWTVFTATAGYGELMQSAGRTLPEFLANLDQLHARVALAFPELKPPSFAVADERPDGLTLHYFTGRQGLAPLVLGLLDGLAERFGMAIDIRHVFDAEATPPHDVFQITWSARPSGAVAGASAAPSAADGVPPLEAGAS